MMIHDIIKIRYSNEGYLPNYPPHLISDEEMFQAFLYTEYSYFADNYRLENKSLTYEYNTLINALKFHICRYMSSISSWKTDIPNWVYQYMLGSVIGQNSDIRDIHYFLVGLNCDNMDDVITEESQSACYQLSVKYINKLNRSEKYFNLDTDLKDFTDTEKDAIHKEMQKYDIKIDTNEIFIRPPSMFGEQNLIKILRLREAGN